MKRNTIESLKVLGWAIVMHVVLILVTFVEVFIYSMLINPGKDQAYYEGHAEVSGPWISGIFGAIFTFLIVRRLIRRGNWQPLTCAIAFPLIYIVTDIAILLPFGINWKEHLPVLLLANGAKVAASFLSYYIYKDKWAQTTVL